MEKSILLYQERIGCTIEALVKELRQVIDTAVKKSEIQFRVKSPESLRKKMQFKKIQSIFLIDDVYGIRIIVESANEAYKVLEKVSSAFSGHLDHDYIKKPKVRVNEPHKGEKLRLLQFIAYRNGVAFEIQITTSEFHAINEKLHRGYKKHQS